MKIGTSTVTAIYLGTTSIVSAYLGATQVFGGASAFTPLDLFSTGAQGLWLDPSDLATMFQDLASTTPVTTPGQPVGRRLDKSGRGNHATAPTLAARPIYGVEPKGGRRNLLTYSEDYSNVVWVKSNATPYIAGVDGNGYSITRLASTAINNFHKVQALGATGVTVGAELSGSIILKADGCNWARVGLLDGGGSGYVFINLVTGAIGTYVTSGNALTGVTVVSSGTAEWRVTFKRIVQGSAVYFDVGLAKADNDSCFFNGTTADAILIRNTQLETGSTATAYQRVTTAYDITESGVATCHYVQYDGSDDSLSTSAIDFTATDKMSVFAGVRKLSDAFSAVLVEFSTTVTNNGAFHIQAPDSPSLYLFRTKGTILVGTGTTSAAFNAPISNVLSGLSDISGDLATLRINGAQVAQATFDQGTGNYANASLFIGRRNNATLPFSGRDFGIIIVGKAASAGEITDTETWLAARTAQVTL